MKASDKLVHIIAELADTLDLLPPGAAAYSLVLESIATAKRARSLAHAEGR